jgi:hypothetical protein
MSTKTTFKRVALVAVAALGFGMLSSVSANAAETTGFTADKASITVIATSGGAVNGGATFKITLANAAAGTQILQSGETLSATVVAAPAGTSTAKTLTTGKADLDIQPVVPGTDNGNPVGNTWTTAGVLGNAATPASLTYGATAKKNNTSSLGVANSYFFQVKPNSSATVLDQGTYTIRFTLTSNDGALVVQNTDVKVTFVSSAALSGAITSISSKGVFTQGVAQSAYTSTKYIKASVTDANGGRLLVEGASAAAQRAATPIVDLIDADGAVLAASSEFTANDAGADPDHGYSSTAGVTDANKYNGDSGITVSTSGFPSGATASGVVPSLRARYGNATPATGAITILKAAAGTVTSVSVSATGLSTLTAAPVVSATDVAAATWYVPLTTTSATVTFAGGTAGQAYSYSVAYTGVATGDQTPLASTPTIVYADSSGKVTVSVANLNPVDGAKADITVSGFVATQTVNTQTISWVKSKAAKVSVSSNGAVVALKSTNTITATVTDNFGAAVSGVQLTPVVSGSNADLATAPRATVTTGADGTASISLTDALAVAAGTDKITFSTVTSGTAVSSDATIKYAATAPAVTTLAAYYSRTAATSNASASTIAAITTPVPTTSIYADSANVKFALVTARDNTKITTIADTTVTSSVASGDQLMFRVSAGVEGAAIVATASTGAYVLNTSNFQKSSVTKYSAATTYDVSFIVGSNVAGTNTITFTSGTATTTVTFVTGTTAANARFVTLTGAAAGVANGDAIPFTAKVTDRYGNAVSSATLTIAATGVGVMLGGSTIQSYTTDSTGTFTFQGTSLAANGGTGTFTVTATNTADYASTAGKVGSTSVDSTLAAGNSSAKVEVVFAAGNSVTQDAAQAASDAAAEATDAANAATDAANAAAEAADAATAAAQDAADAVAALSTQVSEMIDALKKQITALTNLVIKIQKKVKA